MSVLAIIPARAGSKGIPEKNFKELAGISPVERAAQIAKLAADQVIITSDNLLALANWQSLVTWERLLVRPPALAQDDTPMIAVVQHVLQEIPGPAEQIIVLLQPTQPLRTPAHVKAAIALLEESQADSVVSVVPLPLTHHPEFVLEIEKNGRLDAWLPSLDIDSSPDRRQAVECVYIRDGTCYAFRRTTLARFYTIYGQHVRPLVIDPHESCPLDTAADWADAERRLLARAHA